MLLNVVFKCPERGASKLLNGYPPSWSAAGPGSVLRPSIQYAISKIVPGALGLLGVVILFRVIGAREYGSYALATSSAMIAVNFATGWLRQALLRFSSGLQLDHRATLLSGPAVMSVFVAAMMACGLCLSVTGDPLLAIGTILLTTGVGVASISLTSLQAALQAERVAVMESARGVLMLMGPLVACLLLARSGAMAAASAGLASILTVSVVLCWPKRASTESSAHRWSEYWSYGWPLSLWLALSNVFQLSDRFILDIYFGSDVAGSYSAAFDATNRGFGVILFPIILATHPLIMQQYARGEVQGARRRVRRILYLQCGIGFPIIIVAVLLRRPMSILLIGDGTIASILPLLVASSLLWQVALVAHKELEATNRTRTMLYLVGATAILNMMLNLLLLPRFGAVGAASTSLLGSALYPSLAIFVSYRSRSRLSAQRSELEPQA